MLSPKSIFPISAGVLTLCLLISLFFIFYLNYGMFIYAIDDAYIHLALAENIAHGHYGINLGENASPSSSIIWPFLFAPFYSIPYTASYAYLIPLIVNIICAFFVLYMTYKFLQDFVLEADHKAHYILIIMILVIPLFNLPQLVFIGMEHMLQVAVSVALIYSLIKYHVTGQLTAMLIVAIILGPLVRYENVALSAAALIYLFFSNKAVLAIIISCVCAVLLISFSYFLHTLGLEWLPSSVLVKNSLIGDFFNIDNGLYEKIIQIALNIIYPKGLMLLICSYFVYKKINIKKEKLLFFVFFFALALYFIGSMSYIQRYITYIFAVTLLISAYFLRDAFNKFLRINSKKKISQGFLILFLMGLDTFAIATVIPLGSNNIYEQQYQMGRFVKDYYKKPVAVNDLGLVAYKNPNYVLDLVGLASNKVHQLRQAYGENTNLFFKEIFTDQQKDIALAMIYTKWFPLKPKNWELLATLYLGKPIITPAFNHVEFFLTNNNAADKKEIIAQLEIFSKTLPKGVRLEIH